MQIHAKHQETVFQETSIKKEVVVLSGPSPYGKDYNCVYTIFNNFSKLTLVY